MTRATMFEAKTRLSDLVRRAQRGEKVILTSGRDKVAVAEIVAIKPARKRELGQFFQPGFRLPADFDELPKTELDSWMGAGE